MKALHVGVLKHEEKITQEQSKVSRYVRTYLIKEINTCWQVDLQRYSQSRRLLSYRPFPKIPVAGTTPRGHSPIDGLIK